MLGRFQIIGLVGEGGMGQVYRARDDRLGRDVAIKVLHPDFARDDDRMRRFEREARAAGVLNHPHILGVHDIGVKEGILYVVSELLEGETLRQRLAQGALPWRKAVEFGRQIASGLSAAHHKGIVHRDLKPENIFITSSGPLKILDFGLAKLTEPAASGNATVTLSTPGIVLGTVGYMSPEQLRGEEVDQRSDLFAFGAVLYEMLSGNRAFSGSTRAEVVGATLLQEPRDLLQTDPKLPPPLTEIVRHCLEKKADDRFESARDLAFALGTLTDTTVQAAEKQPRSTRPLWLLWVAAALLVATAAAWFTAGRLTAKHLPVYRRLTFRRGFIPTARFAPDGRTVVYSAAWDGKPVELFSALPGSPESRSLGMPGSVILGISPGSEMALAVDAHFRIPYEGTLARAPLAGGAPRELLEHVTDADWSRDGSQLAVVRAADGWQLEYPIGTVLYKAPPNTWISHPRISPRGDAVAFLDHNANLGDTQGSVAIVDTAGKKRQLTDRYLDLSGLAWPAAGGELWASVATADFEYMLLAIRPSGARRQLLTSSTRLVLYDVAPGGRALIGQERLQGVMRGILRGETTEHDLSWFDQSYGRDMSSDAGMLAFDEEGIAGQRTAAVYVRRPGQTPVRLGDGFAIAISPDQQWVLATYRHTNPRVLVAEPTGPGELQHFSTETLEFREVGSWFPDSRHIAISAREPGHRFRSWIVGLDGSKPRPITPEAAPGWLLTPDGKYVLAVDPADRKRKLFPVAGGQPLEKPGLESAGLPLRFSADGHFLFVWRGQIPAEVHRVNMDTGHEEPWKTLMPPEPAGLQLVPGNGIALSGDGSCYVYTSLNELSDLFLVEGVK